jgi:hypothetical protein
MNAHLPRSQHDRGDLAALAYAEVQAAAENIAAAVSYWRALGRIVLEAMHRALRALGGAR